MNYTFKVSILEIPTPFSVGTVNVYLLEAEPLTLIDTGVQTPEAESVLNKGLRDLGYSLNDIKRIFITHGHYDHSGLAGRISAVYGADVYIHPIEASNMKGWANLVRRKAAVCLAGGIPRKIFNEIIDTVQMGEDLVKSLEGYIPLTGGELLPFDGFELEVLHTPGHAPGHLCLFHREQGILLAGDTLLAHITPNPVMELDNTAEDGRLKSLKQYMNSLNLLEELPINRVLTGHGPSISDFVKRIAEIREHHRLRLKKIAEILSDKLLTPYQLALEIYQDLDAFNCLLGVSEVWGHLDILQEAGIVEVNSRNGIFYFKAI